MDSKKIIDHFRDRNSTYTASFRNVQKQIPRFTPLAEGRYDAAAFKCLCINLDNITQQKNDGVPLRNVLKDLLPATIEEANYHIVSDSRVKAFCYLSSIIAAQHVYSDVSGVSKTCAKKFTDTVKKMVKDSTAYKCGHEGGPLRDCDEPEQTGEYLEDMQACFKSELGETLRENGLSPVIEIAQETIAYTNSLKPYFIGWRTQEAEIAKERVVLQEALRDLDSKAEQVNIEGSGAVIENLEGFNPFLNNPEQLN